MSNFSARWMVAPVLATTLMFCGTAGAAEKQKTKPYPHYWLSIATTNQSMPGMSAEMSGMASLFGGKGITSEWPEVWIEDDDRFDEAWALLNGDSPDGEPDSDPDDDDPDESE